MNLLNSNTSGLSETTPIVQLRLIETTDLHLHLLPWDYYTDRPRPGIGLTGAAELVAKARAEARNSLLFDNGDFLQGTPMGDVMALGGGLRAGEVHPAMAAMAALGYDAIGLGNHEFNYGLDFLTRVLADADCPVVCANLALRQGADPSSDRHLVRPWVLLERKVSDAEGHEHLLRIGVLGLAPPQVVDWDRHQLGGRIVARDMVSTARALVPEMRAAGADIVVALAHTGIGSPRHHDGMENAAIPLARVPGIDALMLGHAHMLFPAPAVSGQAEIDPIAGTIAGIPAVMGGCWGTHVGLIDLMLARDGARWQVLGARSEVRGVDQTTLAGTAPAPRRGDVTAEARRVAAAVAAAHRDTLLAVRQPIGTAARPVHNYFAHLGETEALALVAEAQSVHVRRRLAGTSLAGLPLLSSVAAYKSGGLAGPQGYTDIPAGPLALRHVADLYPFPNSVALLRLTGAEVLEWLERAATAYNRIAPGSTGTPLRNPAVAGYHFEVIEPLEVLYDLTRPSRYDQTGRLVEPGARRVVWALMDGQPIDPEAEFLLCTNSYRLGGAGGFVVPGQSRVVLVDEVTVRDVLRDHIAGQPLIRPHARGSLDFAPISGAWALFETGPGAIDHLHEIAGFAPEPRGTTRSGFLRLKIDLSGTSG